MANLIQQRACVILFCFLHCSFAQTCPSVCVCLKEFLTSHPLGVITLRVSVAGSSSLSGPSGETCAVSRVRAVLTECAEMCEGVLRHFERHLF